MAPIEPDSDVMATASSCEELLAELQRLDAEGTRLGSESQRLRTQLRKVRASAHIASSLHQDLFCGPPREPASPSDCKPPAANNGTNGINGTNGLHGAAEVVELKQRLASQEALRAKAAELVAVLEGGGCGSAPSGDVPVTAREARLARETFELRAQVEELEGRVQQLRSSASSCGPGASSHLPSSGRGTPHSQRGDTRRLQQLDSVALRLHEELQRRRSAGSCQGSATSSPPRLPGSRPPSLPSYCGTSFSKLSGKSEVLEQQIEAFYNRFMVRRSGLKSEKS